MGAHPTLLFTGASGLVGATLWRHAIAEGGASDSSHFSKWRAVLAIHQRSAPSPLRRGDRVAKADFAKPGEVERLFASCEPAAVLHAAALASLPACESDPAAAQRVNVDATARLARAAAASGAYFVHLSTDQVFDGEHAPYREGDEARPLGEYGRSKLAAERAVLESGADALILRAALLLAPSADGRSGALDLVRGAGGASEVRLFADEWRTPLSALDLARVIGEALRRRATGILHVAGPERIDRLELGRRIDAAFPSANGPRRLATASRGESSYPRPRDLSLATMKLEREQWPRPQPLAAALAELRALTSPPARG